MKKYDNYENYCKSFARDTDCETKEDTLILQYIQNWIIRMQNNTEKETIDYSLVQLLEDNLYSFRRADSKEDALSNILNESIEAFRTISKNMREKIIRENVMTPSYKVKEINSQGLNWLSRQSGRTIKQKVSSAGNSILAVQRRMSLDTGENRLFVEFAREVLDQLTMKIRYVPKNQIPEVEYEICNELASFLYRNDIWEIRRWENLPPNNTLLSDQNYKKIWNAWNALKSLDELIIADSVNADERLATIFFYEFLTQIHSRVKIVQAPFEIDYNSYKLNSGDRMIFFLDKNDKSYSIKLEKNSINTFDGCNTTIAFVEQGKLHIVSDGKETTTFQLNVRNVVKCAMLYATKIGIPKGDEVNKQIETKRKIDNVVIDLFSLHPSYLDDENELNFLEERVIQQMYVTKDLYDDIRTFYIPCDTASAIRMDHGTTTTYTIPYAVDNESFEQLKRLMHMMEGYIYAKKLSYVFPDAYNEFQLSKIYKAARMAYRHVSSMPLSVGVAFDYMGSQDFLEYFIPNDFVLVLNLLDDELTLTLVKGEFDEDILEDIPDYKGVVWERHPTATISVKTKIRDEIVKCLKNAGCVKAEKIYQLFGIEGILSETNRLSILFDEESWFTIRDDLSETIRNLRFNIDNEIANFLSRQHAVIGESEIHIISLVDNLVGEKFFIQYGDKCNALYGIRLFERLKQETSIHLWHDHLPNLSIKKLYGVFDLIKEATVLPVFTPQKIDIANTFTLPKGEAEYHFRLVQEDSARRMQYEAVVRSNKFPLSEDTECSLDMVYHYGAEDPYTLIFRPINPENAGFAEAKVEWINFNEYEWKNIPVPEFPRKLTWEELETFVGRRGDIINTLQAITEKFELIGKGYETHDLTNERIERNWRNQQCGEFVHVTSMGDKVLVKWSEWDWEKGSRKPYSLECISFLLEDEIPEKQKRYKIDDVWVARTRDNGVWFTNKNGTVMAILKINYNGEDTTIAVSSEKFVSSDEFDEELDSISFEVIEHKKTEQLSAINIHNEDRGRYIPQKYKVAKRIHSGDTPPKHFVNAYYNRWMRVVFANNRSLVEEGCPDDFRRIFAENQKEWLALYHEYDNHKDQNKAIIEYSLAARNIGHDYFPIVAEYLNSYLSGERALEYEIGCALGEYTTTMQKSFLKTLDIKLEKSIDMIGILAKAVWHDEEFIFNFYQDSPEIVLDYLDKAIDYIGHCLEAVNYEYLDRDSLSEIRYCLEYILGVLRLRRMENGSLNKKYLSLNNPNLMNLYQYLEIMVFNDTRIYSFLKLEITNKAYDIPDFMYALLVYVSSYNTDSEIKISGINTDGDSDEEE
ncbi:MAG: DUF2357 domain-containing protein [Suipraeoptans sp.]